MSWERLVTKRGNNEYYRKKQLLSKLLVVNYPHQHVHFFKKGGILFHTHGMAGFLTPQRNVLCIVGSRSLYLKVFNFPAFFGNIVHNSLLTRQLKKYYQIQKDLCQLSSVAKYGYSMFQHNKVDKFNFTKNCRI